MVDPVSLAALFRQKEFLCLLGMATTTCCSAEVNSNPYLWLINKLSLVALVSGYS